MDGIVILWSATSGECLYKISDVFGGPISTLLWVEDPAKDSDYPDFCFGNASGHLVLYGYTETHVSAEVIRCKTCFNPSIGRISLRIQSVSTQSCRGRH